MLTTVFTVRRTAFVYTVMEKLEKHVKKIGGEMERWRDRERDREIEKRRGELEK